MSNINDTSSSEDDWTVVAEQNTPSLRSSTPFDVIDPSKVARGYNSSLDSDGIIVNLQEKNKELNKEVHRLKIENEWMASEIKGARVILSKTFESLCLDHNQEKSNNVREDLICFQNLTKRLQYAVETGTLQKIKYTAPKSVEKPKDELRAMPSDKAKVTTRGCERKRTLSMFTREEASLTKEEHFMKTVLKARLPRMEDYVEVHQDVRPRKTRRMVKGYSLKQRNTLIPAVLYHGHGISRKKRWNLNRGAPRQAFTTRRKC